MVQQWGCCIRQRDNDSTRFLPLKYLDDGNKRCILGQEISGRKYSEPNGVH